MSAQARAQGERGTVTIAGLYCYPVKSCRGFALREARLDAYGLEHDREWMVVDAEGRFLTQRERPRMALIEAALTPQALVLRAPGMGALDVPLNQRSARKERRVRVWHDWVRAVDEGPEAAAWLSAFLGLKCFLVRRDRAFRRPVDPRHARSPRDEVGFADAFPLLVVSQASLDELNARLPRPVGVERFRPNVVIESGGGGEGEGLEPYAEDGWAALRAPDGLTLHLVKPCARCPIPTVDPQTGVPDPDGEPLRTLAGYRRGPDGRVYFGQNAIHEPKAGALRVGMTLVVVPKAEAEER